MPSQLGISFATRTGRSPAGFGALAAAAERAGFDAVFLAEGGSDVLALCPAVIAATRRVSVGTAIANAHLHPPALTAMTAATLAETSGGRFVLGLGVANPGLNHDQLGLPRVASLALLRDYVAVVRAVHAGATYAGEVFGLASPLLLDRPAVAPPIHLAAMRPRMLELAGRIADGVMLNLMSPRQAAAAVRIVRDAAAAAGRDPAEVSISCVLQCVVAQDAERARAAARGVVLRFLRHPSAVLLFDEHGVDEHAAGSWLPDAAAALAAGEPDRAAATVPDEAVDAFVLHGDAAACRARLEDYRGTGIDLPVVFPMPVGGSWDGVPEAAIAAFAPAPR